MYLLEKGIGKPVLVINFKNYSAVQGDRALGLAENAERVAKEKNVHIMLAPPLPSLLHIAKSVKLPVLAQHADNVVSEASTGHIPIFSLKPNGVAGSMLNHSERRLDFENLQESVKMLKKEGLISLVCAKDIEEARMFAGFKPDIIAVEPPELIGSGKAVSKVSPSLVSDSVKAIKAIDDRIAVVCGAGITSKEDVEAAIRLGSEGVLVASAITLSKDKLRIIEEIVEYLK